MDATFGKMGTNDGARILAFLLAADPPTSTVSRRDAKMPSLNLEDIQNLLTVEAACMV